MNSSELKFRILKQRVTIDQVLAAEGVLEGLNRRGNRLVGCCPLHGGDNPRAFVVDLEKGTWYCFTRCGGGGDIVELVRRFGQCSYREAAIYLAALAGPSPVVRHHRSRRAPTRSASFRPFTRRLPLEPNASFVTGKGISPVTARRFECGVYRGHGFLEGCAGVRLHDPEGRPLGYAGRRLDSRDVSRLGKWKMPPALPKSRLLYNIHRLADAHLERLVVVEGPWSVMRLFQLAVPAVALLGVHFSESHVRLLSGVSTVLVMLDGDETGQKASGRIIEKLGSRTHAEAIILPSGHDPDDLSNADLLGQLAPFFLL